MTNGEKSNLLNELLEYEEKNDIGNLTMAERREFQQWVSKALEQEQEPKISPELFKQVTKERDIAIEQLHELGYEFGEKIEPTTKNDLAVDCISRKAAEDITWQDPSYTDPLNILTEVRDKIRELPSVTPQEPRKGHWEHGIELGREYQGKTLVDITYEDWHCSNCHCVIEQSSKPKWSYCPSCGAKLVDSQESEVKE